MIQITGLHKKFGKNEVLKGVDLRIDSGKIYAILGPNGSGKTTLIKSILGMVIPNKGTIEVLGEPIKKGWKYRKQIDYLPQIANFPGNLKVKELISMIKDLRNDQGDEGHLIQMFDLEPHLDKKLANLSGGTKQKVNLVLAFMFDSKLLILDEPNTGLDPNALIQLKDLIAKEKNQGKTLLITSHVMQFVEEVADEIVYLLEGNVYFMGTLKQLLLETKQKNVEHAIAALTKTRAHG